MGRPGDYPAAWAAGRGRLRASHADREQVVSVLKAAFVQGMLAKDEFDLRVSQAFASRTYAELAAVIADIPPGLPTPSEPAPSPDQGGQPVLRPGPVLGGATAAYAAAWAFVLALAPDSSSAPPLIVLGGVVYLGVLLICIAAIVALRRERHPGGRPPRRSDRGPGDQTTRRFPSGGDGKRLPPGQHGHTYSTQAARVAASRVGLPVSGHWNDAALARGAAAASG